MRDLGDTSADEWITWAEAAELTSLPVPTIDYATRVGRITKRTRQGSRPTLNRASALAWAAWYKEQRASLEEQRIARDSVIKVRTYGATPDPNKWVDATQATRLLRVSGSTVRRLVRIGELDGHEVGQLWVSLSSIQAYIAEEARWCTTREAVELIGCNRYQVATMITTGALPTRAIARCKPFLDRQAVIEMRPVWEQQQQDRARARLEEERQREAARRRHAPPDDGDVWLSPRTASLVIGITASALRQRVNSGTIPAVQTPTRMWLRRSDVEIAAAARAFVQAADQRQPEPSQKAVQRPHGGPVQPPSAE